MIDTRTINKVVDIALVLAVLAVAAFLLASPGKAAGKVNPVLDHFDAPHVHEMVATLEEVAAQHPEVPPFTFITDTHPQLGDNAYAGVTFSGTMILNERFADHPTLLNDQYARDVAQGYHRGGCSGARAIALHEFAHLLDQARGNRAEAELVRVYGTGQGLPLPTYAFTSPNEALAEAFQAVKCGVANEVEHNIYRILVTA